jgi:hypothetical protein
VILKKNQTLLQYVAKFIICIIIFWINLDKFTMVKVVKPYSTRASDYEHEEFNNS